MNINMGINLLILLCFQKVQGHLIPQMAPELGANPLKLMEKFYSKCFAEKKTVLFISDNTSYINVPESVNSNSIIILNKNYKRLKMQISSNIAYIQKVDIYIFDVDMFHLVSPLVNIVKKVHGWNVNAHFFVIMSNAVCDNYIGWIFRPLKRIIYIHDISMYLICKNIFYTFNPYALWAPSIYAPYESITFLFTKPDVYYFDFIRDNYKCSDVLYNQLEKIQTPAGRDFVMEISEDDECNLEVSPKKTVMLNYTIRMILLVSKLMKIPFDNYLKCVTTKSYIDAAGIGIGPAIEGVANGKYNALLNPQPMRHTNNMCVSAVTGKMSIVIIMHHRKTLPIFQRIVQFFGAAGFITCLIFGVISALVLKYCLKASFMWSVMQSVALLMIGTSDIRTRRNSLRIFILIVSSIGLALNTTFSNPILSIILGSKYDDVKTVKEFEAIASQYKLYCPPGMDIYVNEFLEQSCYPIPEHGCEIILNDPGAACVYYKMSSYELIVKNNLHMVPEELTQAFVSYKMKTGWRLQEQFNRACTRMFESHIPRVLVKQYIYRFNRELQISRIESQDRIKFLKLKDLTVVFQVLYIGLALAFVSFLCEIKVWNIVYDAASKLC